MNCSEIRELLSQGDDSGLAGVATVRRHVETCESCRAELSQFRDLKAAMAALPQQNLEAPGWLAGAISEAVAEKASRAAARSAAIRKIEKQVVRPQVLTGSALVAAGIAGAFLVRARRRRRGWRLNLRQALAQA